MITFDRHTHTHTDTHTDYFLACKLHWSGELQRPDGLVSTSDFSTGQLNKPFKNDQHNPNYFRLKNWRSVTGVNLYCYNTLVKRLSRSWDIWIWWNRKTKQIMGRTHACTWTFDYISSIPFFICFCNEIQSENPIRFRLALFVPEIFAFEKWSRRARHLPCPWLGPKLTLS